jgi:toxin ParE1/3/4
VSSRNLRLKILPDAKVHIKDILKYTQITWGANQRVIYKKRLYDAFDLILGNPAIGKNRDEIRLGYLSLYVGRHYIFYKVYIDRIEIIAVVHDSMDIEAFFNV